MKLAITLLFVLLLSFSAFGQAKRYEVGISVSGSTDSKSEVESFLKRELRSLGDVDIVETGDFTIFVSAIKLQLKSGSYTGFSVSYDATETISCNGKIYFDLVDSGHQTGGKDDLRKIIESIIIDFDKIILEKKRKMK
jgi:hypothetical protein